MNSQEPTLQTSSPMLKFTKLPLPNLDRIRVEDAILKTKIFSTCITLDLFLYCKKLLSTRPNSQDKTESWKLRPHQLFPPFLPRSWLLSVSFTALLSILWWDRALEDMMLSGPWPTNSPPGCTMRLNRFHLSSLMLAQSSESSIISATLRNGQMTSLRTTNKILLSTRTSLTLADRSQKVSLLQPCPFRFSLRCSHSFVKHILLTFLLDLQ